MLSEWLRVMIEEIARKKAEAQSAHTEQQRRREEHDEQPRSEHDTARR
jgi:hypothetical protein